MSGYEGAQRGEEIELDSHSGSYEMDIWATQMMVFTKYAAAAAARRRQLVGIGGIGMII